MSTTTAAAPPPIVAQLLQNFAMEHKTTTKVLQALPADKLDFKPHERSWTARELAWHIAASQLGIAKVLAAANFEAYQQLPAPSTLEEILAGDAKCHAEACQIISGLTEEQLARSIPLPNGHAMPVAGFLWGGMLYHQIHHRGQLSVYIRMMGGKVPSIYGPSGDDNPFA